MEAAQPIYFDCLNGQGAGKEPVTSPGGSRAASFDLGAQPARGAQGAAAAMATLALIDDDVFDLGAGGESDTGDEEVRRRGRGRCARSGTRSAALRCTPCPTQRAPHTRLPRAAGRLAGALRRRRRGGRAAALPAVCRCGDAGAHPRRSSRAAASQPCSSATAPRRDHPSLMVHATGANVVGRAPPPEGPSREEREAEWATAYGTHGPINGAAMARGGSGAPACCTPPPQQSHAATPCAAGLHL